MLLGLPGLGIVVLVWAGSLAAIGKLAVSRGRSLLSWTLISLVAGAVGCGLGLALAGIALGGDGLNSLRLLAILLPPIMLLVPMAIVGYVLKRSPVLVSARDLWPVHFIPHGEGSISVVGNVVKFTWSGGGIDVTCDQLVEVEADGESVRIRGRANDAELKLSALPNGKPDSPEGRRQQSVALAHQLLGRPGEIPVAIVRR